MKLFIYKKKRIIFKVKKFRFRIYKNFQLIYRNIYMAGAKQERIKNMTINECVKMMKNNKRKKMKK
jgi:hypothetical protein